MFWIYVGFLIIMKNNIILQIATLNFYCQFKFKFQELKIRQKANDKMQV